MSDEVMQFLSPERQKQIDSNFESRYNEAVESGQHLWIAAVAFFVNVPMGEGTMLDIENMAQSPAAGCVVCESPYEPGMEANDCPGEAKWVKFL